MNTKLMKKIESVINRLDRTTEQLINNPEIVKTWDEYKKNGNTQFNAQVQDNQINRSTPNNPRVGLDDWGSGTTSFI